MSFLLASVLWFLLTLNQTYQTQLTYPIHITQYPEGYLPGKGTTQTLELEVEGNGVDLLLAQFKRKKDTIYFRFNEELKAGYFLPQRYLLQIDRDLSGNFRVIRVLTDTVYCPFELQMSKKVKLIPQVEVLLHPGMALFAPPVVRPDSVTISGPENVLDTISQWFTMPFVTPRLNQYGEFRLRVIDTFSNIKVSPREATIFVKPEQYTQTSLHIPIRVIEVPERTRVRLQQDSIHVHLLVPMDRYEALHQRQRELYVSYKELDKSIPFFVPNIRDELPDYVKLIGWEPKKIPYVIIQDQI